MIRWYLAPGGTRDHLIPTCPALVKEAKGHPVEGNGSIGDPFDRTVCGWCQRVYRSMARSGRPPTDVPGLDVVMTTPVKAAPADTPMVAPEAFHSGPMTGKRDVRSGNDTSIRLEQPS